jgi:hypothetical protein
MNIKCQLSESFPRQLLWLMWKYGSFTIDVHAPRDSKGEWFGRFYKVYWSWERNRFAIVSHNFNLGLSDLICTAEINLCDLITLSTWTFDQ